MRKLGLAATLMATAFTVGFGAPARAAGDWKFELTPYVWFVGIDGDMKLNDHKAEFDYSFGDVADHMDMSVEGLAVIQYKQIVAFVQADYLRLSKDDFKNQLAKETIDEVTMDTTLLTLAAGYQFPTLKDSWIDVMVGARFMFINVEVDPIAGDSTDKSKTISDAILVLRPNFHLIGKLRFNPTLSIGAGDSDLVWELQPQFQYDFTPHVGARVGYRRLQYKYTTDRDAELNIAFSGPMLGVSFLF